MTTYINCCHASASLACGGPLANGLYVLQWNVSHDAIIFAKVADDIREQIYIREGQASTEWSPSGFEGQTVTFELVVEEADCPNATASCEITVGSVVAPTASTVGCIYDDTAKTLRTDWITTVDPTETITSVDVVVTVSPTDDVIESATLPGTATSYTTGDLTAHETLKVTITVTVNDSAGGSAVADPICAANIPQADCVPPSLILGACSVVDDVLTVPYEAFVPSPPISTLQSVITNDAGLPSQGPTVIPSGVEQFATIDVSSLQPGTPLTVTVTVVDDCDGKQAMASAPCIVPCEPTTITGLTCLTDSTTVTADYTAASPNFNATLSVVLRVFDEFGLPMDTAVNGTSTQAVAPIGGYPAGDYIARVSATDDCTGVVTTADCPFSICVCPSTDPVSLTVSSDDWASSIDSADAEGLIRTTSTIPLASIPGWPTGINSPAVNSYDGNLPDNEGVQITPTELTYVALQEEQCVTRTVLVDGHPGNFPCQCDPVPITITMVAASEFGACIVLDETVEGVDNPPTTRLKDSLGDLCFDIPNALYAHGVFDPQSDPVIGGWYDEVLTGGALPWQGSGVADHWVRVSNFAAGRAEEHLVLTGVGVDDTDTWQWIVKLFDTTNKVVHRLEGSADTTTGDNAITCEEPSLIYLQSVPGSGVNIGDLWISLDYGPVAPPPPLPDPRDTYGIVDGVDDFVLVANSGIGTFDLQAYSIATWVKPLADENYHILWSYDWTSHDPPYYKQSVQIRTGGIINSYFNSSGGPNSIIYTAGVGIYGTWLHIVLTYESGSQKLYLDGAEVGSETFPGPMNLYQIQPVWVGQTNFSQVPWTSASMHLAESLYYNRALTPQEVSDLFAFSIPASGQVLHYDYDGQVNDQSGNGNNGTFNGTYGP